MDTVRLGVTGLSKAGKTVFLTSLINYLLENGARRSNLFRKADVRLSATKIPLDSDLEPFPYDLYLDGFRRKSPVWPERTTNTSEYHLKLRVKFKRKGKTKEYKLELVDYSGEQILDSPLIDKAYDVWSDEVVGKASLGARKNLSRSWLKACEGLDCNESKIEQKRTNVAIQYADYLRACKDNGLDFLQPSQMIRTHSGDEGPLLFCPLPSKVRKAVPSVAKAFATQYDSHVSEKVKRFGEDITKCSRQIVLVDVLRILRQGVDVYNDAHECLNSVLDAYSYRESRGRLVEFFGWLFHMFSGEIDRVAFVATKADQAARAGRGNMKVLLEDLVREKHDQLLDTMRKSDQSIRFFFAAARRCTQDATLMYKGKELSALKGRRADKPPQNRGPFYPGEVPSEWPDEAWDQNEKAYRFPDFLPKQLPARDGAFIDHINLDRILLYIVGGLR